MGDIANLIKAAESQVGYLEKKSNSFLDHFTKNAGTKNFTKYAEEYKKFTGQNLQGQAWCDMFVDCNFVVTFGKDKAKRLLGNFSAYTPTSANYFKVMDQWLSEPLPGDVIFFKNSERICHTGIVVEVSNTKVYTIEGNTSGGSEVIPNGGGVCKKSYYLSNSKIAGYGRPKYDYIKPTMTITSTSSIDDILWLQTQLNKALKSISGFAPLKADGKFGNNTRQAVIKFYELQGWKNYGDGGKVGHNAIKRLDI